MQRPQLLVTLCLLCAAHGATSNPLQPAPPDVQMLIRDVVSQETFPTLVLSKALSRDKTSPRFRVTWESEYPGAGGGHFGADLEGVRGNGRCVGARCIPSHPHNAHYP